MAAHHPVCDLGDRGGTLDLGRLSQVHAPGPPRRLGPSEILYMAVFAVVAGGVLGATEGVVIVFPLAGLLGLFGDRD